ncbi:MAG TPA: YncE family protein [Terriglobia bacterium]
MTASIPVAPGPVQVIARSGARELFVLSQSGILSIISYPELKVVAAVSIGRVGSTAANLVLTGDGRLAASDGAGEIVFMDCAARAVTGRLRLGGDISALAFTPDGKTLVAADRSGNRLIFIDTLSRKVLGDVPVGKAPGPMVVLPDGSKLFVADTGEPKLSAIDVANRQVLSHIEIGSDPVALVLKPDGGEIIALSRDSALTILDAFHDYVEQEMPTGTGPIAAVSTRDSARLYVANGDGSVQAIDLQNRSLPSSVISTHVGTAPAALALTPDERFLVVADLGDSSLAVLRTAPINTKPKPEESSSSLPLITAIPVGARPVDVTIPDWLR